MKSYNSSSKAFIATVWPKDAASEPSTLEESGIDQSSKALISDKSQSPSRARGSSLSKNWRSGLSWWAPELLSSALSFVALISIVLVLRVYNGAVVADLALPKHLTLNGIVAAIATLNRAFLIYPVTSALSQELWIYYASEASRNDCSSRLNELNTYDIASRGPWGSLEFLCYYRGRRIIACLCAIVSILALGFGTFIQQLIAFDANVPVHRGSRGAVGNAPASEVWNSYVGGNWASGHIAPPSNVIAAFYDGFLRNDITPIEPACPSGNCTWPLTPSLGVCGGCVDSKYTKRSCFNPDPCPKNGTKKGSTDDEFCDKGKTHGYCHYTLPSGLVATIYNPLDSPEYMYDHTSAFQVLSYGHATNIAWGQAHFSISKLKRAYLANFNLFGYPRNTYVSPFTLYPSAPPLIQKECALWMCTQLHNISVVEGKQRHNIVAQANEAHGLHTIGDVIDNTSDKDVNITWVEIDSPRQEPPLLLSANAWYSFYRGVTQRLLQGTGHSFGDSRDHSTSDIIQAIWDGASKGDDAWIDNVALSMTNVIRKTNSTSKPEYDGISFQLGVRVRWIWLVLPVALVMLSLILLLGVMYRTANSPVAPWKGSPLTFLIFDVSERVKAECYSRIDEPGGLKMAVGNTRVRLTEERKGSWKFKAC